MGKEGNKEKEKNRHKTRDPKWSLWETQLAIEAVIAVRDKYAQAFGVGCQMVLLSGFSLSCVIYVCLLIKSLDTQVQKLHYQINQYPQKA